MSDISGNGVNIDTSTVRAKLVQELKDNEEILRNMVETGRQKVEDSKQYYDSSAATSARSKMDEFAENVKKGTQENLTNAADFFEKTTNTYDNLNEEIKSSEEEYLSTGIFE